MNALKVLMIKQHEAFLRYFIHDLRTWRLLPAVSTYGTSVDVIDAYTNDLVQRQREKLKSSSISAPDLSIQHFRQTSTKYSDVTMLTDEELDKTLQKLLAKNKDKQLEQILTDCYNIRKLISDMSLKTMLKQFSSAGKPELVSVIQKYFAKVLPNSYRRNGEFAHYYAKAQCMKGNSEKGLSILQECYKKNENLRSLYRVIFRDLIQDSVLNRSEASLVVFKKYVLEFSNSWEEHYPLVCFWHICWLSSWYSDQMLSNELWELSEHLREIVGEKVTALSISALKTNYNEDAIVRLLQTLLKYKMLTEYANVLHVLFGFKLKNRDLRGCTEIIRNCEVLGITLPSNQQGQYIKMMIHRSDSDKPVKPTFKDFKLKF